MTKTTGKTLMDILDVVDGARQQFDVAESEKSHANSLECRALNNINEAAKQTVNLLIELPDQFIKEFDEKWNSNSVVRAARPQREMLAGSLHVSES
jgi:hypothetical protein